MKSSDGIEPLDDDERYVWSFDQRDLDNPNKMAFTRLVYMERVAYIIKTVKRFLPLGAKIADIGCAQGNIAITLAEFGYRVDAFDLNASFLSYGSKKYERGDLTWHGGNIFDLVEESESFDGIVLGEIVEHVAHPDALIRRCVGLLQPGGVLVVTTPNGRYIRERLPSYSDIIASGDLPRIEEQQFGPGGEHHLFAYTLLELRSHVPPNSQLIHVGYLGSGLLNSHVQRLLDTPYLGKTYGRLAVSCTRLPLIRTLVSLSLVLVIRRSL
ncbi:MAG: class I SAM-dependent methyltransferase [Acidimicrobiales bacterium]